jgi:hypothetical protein
VEENAKQNIIKGGVRKMATTVAWLDDYSGLGEILERDEDLYKILNKLSVISIGEPEASSFSDIYSPRKMDRPIRAMLKKADFHHVRLACSFNPNSDEERIKKALFVIRLHRDSKGNQPIISDMHPIAASCERKKNINVMISPQLKFLEIGASLGGMTYNEEYIENEPTISAIGIGEHQAKWNYKSVAGNEVQGSKKMHMLLRVPKGMEFVYATMYLIAEIQVRGSIIRKRRTIVGIKQARELLGIHNTTCC